MESAANFESVGLVGSVDAFDFLAIARVIEDIDAIGAAAGGHADDDVALFAGKGA